MKEKDKALYRSQIYSFLAEAFLYPAEWWAEDVVFLNEVLKKLGWQIAPLTLPSLSLAEWQEAHRRTFGAAGSLCYETEYGLPHEYRQSQELADLGGFYHAFGFEVGGAKRERGDHIAVELEFMYVLALKELLAYTNQQPEKVEICTSAEALFLQDHLGRWFALFGQGLRVNAPHSPYLALADFAQQFVAADMQRLGVEVTPVVIDQVQHTPYDNDFSCATCDIAQKTGGYIPLETLQ